jgi:uncharacterized 2Fe-2S/4Fe-4S cluster protein (DUF4445 family)
LIIPDRKEASILVSQHQYTVKLPFMPGLKANMSAFPHGVAIDVGTTTLVFYLVNLITGTIVETRSMLNPQTRFGGDVITRINHAAQKDNGLEDLQRAIVVAINSQLHHFTEVAGIPKEELIRITITGNTTMLHLLKGVDPLPIALAPFNAPFLDEQLLNGKTLGLKCHPEAEVKLLPSISAYVGSDIVAGLASIVPSEKYQRYLFMDIGTNGELALVTPEKIWCCATAAGPAFEGARISCGLGAVAGAISTFENGSYGVIGDEAPVGICGSGLIDVVAFMIDQDLVSHDGLIEEDFELVSTRRTGNGLPISITQQDIREVQLAKSAIAAGVNVLLRNAGLAHPDIDAVFLAGGFGNYINHESAMKIGLISPEFRNKIISLGNTSGTGAVLALRSIQFDNLIETLIGRTEYIELSQNDEFTIDFAMNMMFGEQNV